MGCPSSKFDDEHCAAAVIVWAQDGAEDGAEDGEAGSDAEGGGGAPGVLPDEQTEEGGWDLYYRSRTPEAFHDDMKVGPLKKLQKHGAGKLITGLRKKVASKAQGRPDRFLAD